MTAPTPNAMPGATAPAPEAPPASPPAAPPAPPAQTQPVPPWEKAGEEFNPERAWNLIQNKDRDLAALKAKTDPIISEWEQLRRASQSDLDRVNEDLGKATTAAETWREQAIRSKAEALASGRFVDAETALALIGDVSQFVTGDAIDVAKLTARLDQLAVDKPFLVAAPAAPPGFAPNRAQGQSGTGPPSLDAEISAALAAGDITRSIALKQQKLYGKR